MPSCKGLFTSNVPICNFLEDFARFCKIILSTRIWRLFSLSPPCESPSCVTKNPSACLTLFQRLFSKQATCQSESQALTFLELFYEKPLQLCQSASKQAVKDQRLQKPIQAANLNKHIHGQIVVSSHMLSFWQKIGLKGFKREKRHWLLETALCGTPEQIFGSQQLSFEFNPLWDFFLFENFLRHLGTIVGKYAWWHSSVHGL